MKNEIRKHLGTAALLALATCLAIASLCGAWRSWDGEVFAYNPENLLRLHIIPDSDEPFAQELKLKVRDAILKRLEPEFSRMKTSSEALSFIVDHQDIVLDTIHTELVRHGSGSMDCRIELGVFEFPDRAYGDLFVPAGKYQAMRVVLGQGSGQNWWCVLFPPLCFKDLTQATSGEQKPAAVPVMATGKAQPAIAPRLVDEESLSEIKVEYRLRLVDWLETKRSQALSALARIRPAGAGK